MKILVTGASGFVGSHIADRLIDSGHTVRALLRPTSSLQWLEGKPVEIARANLLNTDSLKEAVVGIDAVVHVAGVTAAKNKEGFYQGNQLPTRALLDAVRKFNPGLDRFIQRS